MFKINKRGDWEYPESFFWFFGGLIFLYVSLMPFKFLPFSVSMNHIILEILIIVAGILIFIESFGGIGFSKFIKVVVGLIFVAFGILLMLVDLGVILSGSFDVSTLLLQIVLIVYSVYLFIGAWMQ